MWTLFLGIQNLDIYYSYYTQEMSILFAFTTLLVSLQVCFLIPFGFHFDAHICYKEKWEHPYPCLNIKSQDTQLKNKEPKPGMNLFF
jgi:hypothetical protein